MSQSLGDYQDMALGPQREVWPRFGYWAYSGSTSTSFILRAAHGSAIQNHWLTDDRSVLSLFVFVNDATHPGGTLYVHAAPISEFNYALSQNILYALTIVAGMNYFQGLQLPALYITFELLPSANNMPFLISLKLEARQA